MRLRNWVGLLLTLLLGFALVGCGGPSATQMIRQLQSAQAGLTSYESKALMTVHVQGTMHRYYVETKYQSPNLYSISLGNENREISQIIVHNAQGIFIISPGTKKVIRFQGDWAEKQGHLYLYHSLIGQIISAGETRYSVKDQVASFVMATDPLNPLIHSQRISLDIHTLAPRQVIVYDKQQQAVITMDYQSFRKGVTFPADTFSPNQVTTLQTIEMPVSSVEQGFGVIEPTFVPTEDQLVDESEQNGVVYVRYDGQEPFTMIESRPAMGDSLLGQGSLLTLYGIPAVLMGSGPVHELLWINRNVEFLLTSKMGVPDLIRVAASTVESVGK